MADAREMVLLIKADPSGMKAGLDQSQSLLDKMVGGLGKVGLAGLGIGAIAGGAKAAAEGLFDLAKGAEGAEKAQLRSNTVFGQAKDIVNKFASTAATSIGMTRSAVLQAAGGFGQFFTNLKIGESASADMSVNLIKMAGDLAKFNNVSRDDALSILQKGMSGSTRGLKQLGIAVDENSLKQKALSLGLYAGKGALDASAKAQATYAILLEQTKRAHEAVSGGLPSVSAGFKKLDVAIADAKEQIGQKLLPILGPMVNAFASFVPSALGVAMAAFDRLFAVAGPPLRNLSTLVTTFAKSVLDSFANAGDWSSGVVETITGSLSEGLQSAGGFLSKIGLGWVTEIISPLAFGLKDAGPFIDQALKSIQPILERVGPVAREAFGNFVTSVGDAAKTLQDLMPSLDDIGAWMAANKDIILGIAAAFGSFVVLKTATEAASGFGESLQGFVDSAAGAIEQLTGLTEIAGGPLNIALGALALGMGALAVAWQNDWGGIQEKTADALSSLVPGFESLKSSALDSLKMIEDGFASGGLTGALQAIPDALSNLLPDLQAFGSDVLGWLNDQIGPIGQSLGGWVTAFGEWVGPATANALTMLGELLASLGSWLVDTGLPALASQLTTWGQAFMAWIGPAIGPMLQALGDLLSKFGGWLTGTALPAIVAKLKEWATAFGAWVPGAVQEFLTNWPTMLDNLLTKIGEVSGFIINKLLEWAEAFIAWIPGAVANLVPALMGITAAIVAFVVETGATLIGKIAEWLPGMISGVVRIAGDVVNALLGGMKALIIAGASVVGGAVIGIVTGLYNAVKPHIDKAVKIGSDLIDGLVKAIKDNAQAVMTALGNVLNDAIAGVKKLLGIASPSKVFEQIAMYIMMGLEAGLAKYDVKAVEAMQKVVASITGVMSNIPNFFKSLKEMVIPSDSDLSDMRAKFESVVDIMERFVKSMALRSVAVGVGDPSMIPQNIVDELKAAKLDPGQLISGGDVGNVGGMMDILGKVAGAWKGIADSLTAISAIKIPDTSQLEAVKAAAWALVLFAENVANDMPAVPEFGAVADLLTDAVKGVQAVAKLDLSDFKPVDLAAFRGVLNQVGSMMLALQTLASNLTGGMALDETGRKAIDAAAANAKAYFGAISDIAKSVGEVADLGSRLSEIKAMSFDSLGSLELIITVIASIGANLTSGLRGLDPNRLKDDYSNLKEYFGAISEIAKTLGDVGDLGSKLKDATLATADQIAIAGENARLAFERGDALSLAFRALSDQGKVIADSVKNWTSAAGDSVKLIIDSVGLGAKTKDATAALYTNLLTAADNAAQALGVVRLFTGDWELLADQGKSISEAVKNWTTSSGAAVELILKASGLGEALAKATSVSSVRLRFVRQNISEAVDTLKGVIDDLQSKGYTDALIAEMAKWTDGLGKIYDLFAKAGGVTVDWSKVSTVSSVRFRFIRDNIAEITLQMKELYEDLTSRGFATELLVAIGAWASAVAGIVSSFGGMIGSLAKLAESKGGSIGAGVVDQAIANIRAVVTAFSTSGITAEASAAAKALAEAAGPALDVLSKALDVFNLDKIAQTGFLGKPGQSAFMTRAGETWAKSYADRIKAGIRLMLQTLSDVFSGADAPKPPSQAVADSIAAMVKAYDPLIDLIAKISGMTVDLKRFGTVMAAAAMLQAGMAGMPASGGGGPAGTGGGQGSPPGSGGGSTPFSAPGTLKIDRLEIANQVTIDTEAVAEIVTSKSFQQAVQLYYVLKPGAA